MGAPVKTRAPHESSLRGLNGGTTALDSQGTRYFHPRGRPSSDSAGGYPSKSAHLEIRSIKTVWCLQDGHRHIPVR